METVWESYFKNLKESRDSSPDFRLLQYFELINNGNVLDLGIGEGRNSVPFAINGFYIDGVDTSDTGLSYCKEIFKKYNRMNFNLVNCDIKVI